MDNSEDKTNSTTHTSSSFFFVRPNCDGFMVGSNKTDISLGTVDIPHEGPEEYNNIWQKVMAT